MTNSSDSSEPGPYGFGTGPAFETLMKRLSEKKIPSTCLIAINIDTLVRNTISKDLKVYDIVNKVCGYMSNMATHFAALVNSWPIPHNYMIFYHADPKVVPKLFLREHNGPTGLMYTEALKGVLERVKNSKTQSHGNVTSMICVANEIKQPSYKGLAEVFNKLTEKTVTVHMISHNPIDWHIQRTGRIGILYRSYTGVAVEMTATNLGEIAFGEKGIPFYPRTHVLMGDKSIIKGILGGSDKKNFRELCLRERFVYRSEDYINHSSKINSQLIPYELT